LNKLTFLLNSAEIFTAGKQPKIISPD